MTTWATWSPGPLSLSFLLFSVLSLSSLPPSRSCFRLFLLSWVGEGYGHFRHSLCSFIWLSVARCSPGSRCSVACAWPHAQRGDTFLCDGIAPWCHPTGVPLTTWMSRIFFWDPKEFRPTLHSDPCVPLGIYHQHVTSQWYPCDSENLGPLPVYQPINLIEGMGMAICALGRHLWSGRNAVTANELCAGNR